MFGSIDYEAWADTMDTNVQLTPILYCMAFINVFNIGQHLLIYLDFLLVFS